MNKVLLCARREYKATALTKAFFFGAVVFPLFFLGAIIITNESGILRAEKPPISGSVAIIDGTPGARVAEEVAQALDPKKMQRAIEQQRAQLELMTGLLSNSPLPVDPERLDQLLSERVERLKQTDVTVETLETGTEIAPLRERLMREDLLALVIVGPNSMVPVPSSEAIKSMLGDFAEIIPGLDEIDRQFAGEPDPEAGVAGLAPGRHIILHQRDLDPDYLGQIRRAVRDSIERRRYLDRGIDPMAVRTLETTPPAAQVLMVGDDGSEEDSTADAGRIIPIAFFLLLYVSTLTGGSYLFYGTLEEKGSRVMEVVLSAISPVQMMVGKIIGQGLVGLTVLAIYMALGLFAVDRFDMWSIVPIEAMLWMLPYFLMAYLFFGALYIALGSAVTEIREAAALQAPLLFLIVVIFIILFPILENPGSPVARVMSYFPPTTPFVMVIRLSQPAHTVPLWEILATGVVGALGVALTIWFAAKIFRVGVLMYGKPPSFGTLLKWVMQS